MKKPNHTDREAKIAEITEALNNGITELFQTYRFKNYLQVMGRFHNYSFRNTLLIYMQRPDTKAVAGYQTWKKLHRQVESGSKGISIILPAPFKRKVEVERRDDKGNIVIGADGKPMTDTETILVPSYRIGYVFAYEDTSGEPLPSIVKELTGKIDDYAEMQADLESISPVPIMFEPISGSAYGYYSNADKSIHVKEGLSECQTIKTTIHELAHALLHAENSGIDTQTTKREREVSAEAVAFSVCSYYGLDTSDYSLGYIAGWSSSYNLEELQQKMDTIRSCTNTIISSLEQRRLERLQLHSCTNTISGCTTTIASNNPKQTERHKYSGGQHL